MPHRREGSLALLTSLVHYQQGEIEPTLLGSLLQMRLLFEVEAARLAAGTRNCDQLTAFDELLEQEAGVDPDDPAALSELDYQFHHLVAMASGNLVYPLLLNSFKGCYLNLAGQFYSDPTVAVWRGNGTMLATVMDGSGSQGSRERGHHERR